MADERNSNTGTFILLAGASLALVLFVSCLAGLGALYHEELRLGRQNLQRLSFALSEQTALTFQEIDGVLQETRHIVAPVSGSPPRDVVLHRLLQQRFQGLLQGQALLVFGPDGRMLGHSREFPTPDVQVLDRKYFQIHAAADADRLYVSQPLRNRVNHRWMISLSRRLSTPEGEFGGVVMAAVEMDYFVRLYQALNLPRDSRISLRRDDGVVLVTYPFDESALGKAPLPPDSSGTTVVATTPVAGLPLSIGLSVPRAELLRHWYGLVWTLGPGTLAAILGIAGLTWALLVRERRDRVRVEEQKRLLEEKVRQRTHELRDALDFNAMVLAASPVGIAVFGEAGECVTVNDVFCRMAGADRTTLLAGTIETVPSWRQGDLAALVRHTLETGETARGEGWFDPQTGAGLWMAWQCVRFFSKVSPQLLFLATDITGRKQAEATLLEKTNALAENEERLRTLINAMPDVVCFKDGQGRWLEANTYDIELFRLEGLAYQGKRDVELAELRPENSEAFATCATTDEATWQAGRTMRWEETIPDRNGETRVFDVLKVPLFHANGSRRGLVVVGRDISEQKRSQSLIGARMRLSELAEHGGVDDITRLALDEAEALTGSRVGFLHFLEEDQVTLHLQAWSTNTMRTMCKADRKGGHYPVSQAGIWADCIRERRPVVHNDYPGLARRGGLPPGHAAIVREVVIPVIREGRIDLVLGVGNKPNEYSEKDVEVLTAFAMTAGDLIMRKRAEEELRRMGALLTSMLRNLPLDFWARDRQMRLIIQSDISREYWGDQLQTTIEAPDLPRDVVDVWQMNNSRALAGEVVAEERSFTLPGGRTIYVQERVAPIRSAGGEIIGIMGVNVDLTPNRQLEIELRAAKESAEAANRSKSDFLANMSHEIRTPLNGILGMLQLMESTAPNTEQQEYLQAAILSAKRLTRLLSDILDLSRVEAGKLSIQEAVFEVAGLRSSILDIFQLLARSKGLELAFVVDPGVPSRLVGDEARLRQILSNLVGNALKFTTAGHVRITVEALPYAAAGRMRVLFTVDDTGPGIADDRLVAIFEPFVQGGAGGEPKARQGAGLGLSIVRRLVRLMDGELAVDNHEGGTTIHLSLPFGLAPEAETGDRAPVAAGEPHSGRRRRILVVEDEGINRLAVKRMLEKAGHAVTEAGNGQEALSRLAGAPFDAILMDIQMPVMDGLAASRAIREIEADRGSLPTPIVAMTAYAMAGDRERFLAAGMDDYLAKPVEFDALRRLIDRLPDRRPGGDDPA